MSKFISSLALAGLIAIGIATVPTPAQAGKGYAKPAKNIVQTARDAGTFNTLIAALEAADLTGTLSGQGKGKFTVLAPTDAAFAKLPAGTVEALLKDPAALRKILLYHVVEGDNRAAVVVKATSLKTLNGQSITVSTAGGVKVNNANVTATDIVARNGVIHVIDTVLLPS